MRRAVVNVATGERYERGQRRLLAALIEHHGADRNVLVRAWTALGCGWPTHQEKPYAFKAYALFDVAREADLLLWCDASVVPIRSLEPLWQLIEKQGYWFSHNGFTNYEWTADSAYDDLFSFLPVHPDRLDGLRGINRHIPHVVGTAFGLNVRHCIGRLFLDEYYRLASETRAFCGPWRNTPQTPCGPPDVSGHRHDQTAASVLVWRLGMNLTNPPAWIAYAPHQSEETILLVDGSFEK